MRGKIFKTVFVRHGESTWNQQNKFTGWCDVPLSSTGQREALQAGIWINENKLRFDVAFTSVLRRAVQTFNIIAEETDHLYIPVIKSWRLNERHYGALQGLNKSEMAKIHGEDKVKIWRRSFDIPPPPLDIKSPLHAINEEKYRFLPKNVIPSTESLKLTIDRVTPYWYDMIAPAILSNKKVIICAHGNSLRGLVKMIDKMNDKGTLVIRHP